jgi:hypothetical protein
MVEKVKSMQDGEERSKPRRKESGGERDSKAVDENGDI